MHWRAADRLADITKPIREFTLHILYPMKIRYLRRLTFLFVDSPTAILCSSTRRVACPILDEGRARCSIGLVHNKTCISFHLHHSSCFDVVLRFRSLERLYIQSPWFYGLIKFSIIHYFGVHLLS